MSKHLAIALTIAIWNAPAHSQQVASQSQCDVALDRMIKSSGLGESRRKLGSRVSATSFSKADLAKSSRPTVVTNATLLNEVELLKRESSAANDRFNETTDELRAIAQETSSVQPLENADVFSTLKQLRAKRKTTYAKWKSERKRANATSDKLSAYLDRHDLVLDFIDGKHVVVYRNKADSKLFTGGQTLPAHSVAKSLVSSFSPALSKSHPPFEYDEIEIVQDNVKQKNYWSHVAELQNVALDNLEASWLSTERDALAAILEKTPNSRRMQIEKLLSETMKEAERAKQKTEGFDSFNRRSWEMRRRPLVVFKKGGKLVGAIDRDDDDHASNQPERGFRCVDNKVSAGWLESFGFVPTVGSKFNCKDVVDLVKSGVCTGSYNFEFNGFVIPNPDSDIVYGHSEKPPSARPSER